MNKPIHWRYKKEEEDAPEKYQHNPKCFLRKFLSVDNLTWYQKLFYEGNMFLSTPVDIFPKRDFNELMLDRFISAFGVFPIPKKNSPVYLKLRDFGKIAA